MGRTRFGLLDTIESIPLETKKRIVYKEAKKKNDSDGNKDDDKVEDSLIQTTYNDLKQLRDEGKLVPGALYRITDYNCTTIQEGTRSAGHQFDIIVQALSENVLSEDAKAIQHEGVDESAIGVYSEWDDSQLIFNEYKIVNGIKYAEYTGSGNKDSTSHTISCLFDIKNIIFIDYDNEAIYPYYFKPQLIKIDSEDYHSNDNDYNIEFDNDIRGYFFNSNLAAWKLKYCLDNDDSRFAWADTINGVGVIYQMIDEYNNDCPYDFKNIQFLRSYTDFFDEDYSYWAEPIFGFVPDNDMYFYTFNYFNETINEDYSVIQQNINDNINKYYVYDNCIKKYIENNNKQRLNNIIIVSSSEFDSSLYAYETKTKSIYGNKFGLNCENITIGPICICNNFGDNVNDSIFFLIYDSIIGNNCSLQCIDVEIFACKFDNNTDFDLSNTDGDIFEVKNMLYNISLSGYSLYVGMAYESMICFYDYDNDEVVYRTIQNAFILS